MPPDNGHLPADRNLGGCGVEPHNDIATSQPAFSVQFPGRLRDSIPSGSPDFQARIQRHNGLIRWQQAEISNRMQYFSPPARVYVLQLPQPVLPKRLLFHLPGGWCRHHHHFFTPHHAGRVGGPGRSTFRCRLSFKTQYRAFFVIHHQIVSSVSRGTGIQYANRGTGAPITGVLVLTVCVLRQLPRPAFVWAFFMSPR